MAGSNHAVFPCNIYIILYSIYIIYSTFYIPLGLSHEWRLLARTRSQKPLWRNMWKIKRVWDHRKRGLNSLHFTKGKWWLVTGAMLLDAIESSSPIISSHDSTFVVHAVGIIKLCQCMQGLLQPLRFRLLMIACDGVCKLEVSFHHSLAQHRWVGLRPCSLPLLAIFFLSHPTCQMASN